MTDLSLDPRIAIAAKLNTEKAHLMVRDDQTATQWLDLARRYQAIDSRANYSGCMWRAKSLGYVEPATIQTAEPEFERMEYTDV
jgi:hypothetical protein